MSDPTDKGPNGAIDRRTVVVHYHFFKCAGTSVSHALSDAFGDRFVTWEGPDGRGLSPAGLSERIEGHPEVRVVSSHTAYPPPPELPDVTVVPVVFLRHPLDRVRSVYEFERRQKEPTLGARMAKENDLAGFIEWGLADAREDPRMAEFQTTRLGGWNRPDKAQRAMDAVVAWEFIGVVEEYEPSLAALQTLLQRTWAGVRLRAYHDNAMRGGKLDERLRQFRQQIGIELYARLERANQSDLAIWRAAMARYNSR